MSAASPKSFLLSARTLWGRRTHRLLGLAAFPKDPYGSCLLTFRRKRIRRKIPDWPDKALGDCQTTEEFRPWTIRRTQPLRLSRRRSQQTCGLTRQGLLLFAESQHLAWPEQLAALASRPTPNRLAPQRATHHPEIARRRKSLACGPSGNFPQTQENAWQGSRGEASR